MVPWPYPGLFHHGRLVTVRLGPHQGQDIIHSGNADGISGWWVKFDWNEMRKMGGCWVRRRCLYMLAELRSLLYCVLSHSNPTLSSSPPILLQIFYLLATWLPLFSALSLVLHFVQHRTFDPFPMCQNCNLAVSCLPYPSKCSHSLPSAPFQKDQPRL